MKKQLIIIFMVVFALFACSAGTMAAGEGRIIYVNCTATGDNTGSSWGNAFTTLQAALDVAQPGDEIWVAEGTYKPTSEYGLGIGERGKHFEMKNGVGIYGGFAGTEDTRTGRDWTAHPTILSGNIGIEGDAHDNCYHVFYHPDGLALNQTAVLDGFTITGGNAYDSFHQYEYYYECGGGMYNKNSSPTLTNLTFSGNKAHHLGGGMYNDNSSPKLTSVTYSGNSVYWDGGGMYNYNNSSPTLTSVTFSRNTASNGDGGGMYNDNSSPTLTSVIFSGNNAGDGGGMLNYKNSSPALTNVTFNGNSFSSYNGSSGGMSNHAGSHPTLTNCILWGNRGIQIYYSTDSSGTVTYSDIQGGFPGNGNIDADPLFVGPDNLRLQFGSPCINTGSNDAATVTNDLDGNPRIIGDIVDMGAYEFQGPFSLNAPAWPSGSSLTASNVTETGLTLTWTAATDDVGVTSYKIYINGNLLDTVNPDTVDGTPTPYNVTGLTAGTHYTFKVEAGNAAGNWSTTGPSVTVTGIIYVNGASTGDNTDSSWGNAFTTLQAALNVAQPGEEIWVAAGTYKPTSEYGLGIGERGKHFEMKNGVGIYGGFAGTEDTRDERDWTAHPTILSGDIGAEGDAGDNCYHVFYHPDGLALNQTAVLDGFTVAGGNADSGLHYNDYYGSGGGMYNINSSPTLTNVIFSGNGAGGGGGMCNYNSSLALTNVTFSGNRAGDGGGMLNYKSSPALTNVTFSANSAWSKGGGMTNSESSPTLINVTFSNNLSSYEGGGMYNDKSSPTLTNVTFSGNSGSGNGGANGGGMYNYYSNPTLTNVIFSNNSSNFGGGMENWYSSPTLTNVTFSGNSVKYYGGGMYNYSSSPVLTNCILWGNSGAQIAAYEESSSIPTVTYSDIQGGFPGNGNIDADPLFEGPDNLWLQFGSPCINMGSNDAAAVTTDLDGNPRIVGVNVDMGAYEFQGPFPPSAPTWPSGSSLTASNVTETGLTLTWTAATDDVGVTSYKIYKNGNILDTVNLDNVNGTPAPYNVTGLTAGTQYTLKVEAGDAEGNWSTTGPSVTITIQSTPPTWPPGSKLTASNVTETGGMTLAWTAATDDVGVTGYRIYKNGGLLDTVDGTTRYYNVTGIDFGDIIKYWQFTFKVEAGDAMGNWSTTGPSVTVTNPMYDDIPSGGGGGVESFPLPSVTPSYFEQY